MKTFYIPNFQIAFLRDGKWCWDGLFITTLNAVRKFINDYDLTALRKAYRKEHERHD